MHRQQDRAECMLSTQLRTVFPSLWSYALFMHNQIRLENNLCLGYNTYTHTAQPGQTEFSKSLRYNDKPYNIVHFYYYFVFFVLRCIFFLLILYTLHIYFNCFANRKLKPQPSRAAVAAVRVLYASERSIKQVKCNRDHYL